MKNIKKYTHFLNESDDIDELSNDDDSIDYSDITDEIKDMIEKSLKTSDIKTIDDFISAYIRNPEETQIEGLINDSDVYDFYLKWRNDIDQLLSKINFYDEIPSELSCFSLYDYIIKGTKKAIEESINIIKND